MTQRARNQWYWLSVAMLACSVAACESSLQGNDVDAGAGRGGGGGGRGGGGSGGGVGGGWGGGMAAGGCGTHEPLGPSGQVTTLGPTGGAYDGPAIIERSNAQNMVVMFTLPGTGGGTMLPMHAEISRMQPMPILPVGARVWLSKIPAGNQQTQNSWVPLPWALTLRSRQGGELLFGMSRDVQDQAAAPVQLRAPVVVCTEANPDPCGPGSMVSYGAFEVQGDRGVVVADSETGVVRIGGIDYDVRVGAQRSTPTTGGSCGDYYPPNGMSLDVRAHDLAPLAAALTVDPLPACSDSNEVVATLSANLINAGLTIAYDGPVRFTFASTVTPDLYFTVDLPNQPGVSTPPSLEIRVSPELFPAPAANAEFWFTKYLSHAWVLRGPQRGPVLLAAGGATTTNTAGLTDLATELGVTFTGERRCAYGTDSAGIVKDLFDGVVGTSPPVRVPHKKATLVQIAGRDYTVFMGGIGYYGASLVAR